ncbi:hypothetical protein CYY_005232 [Polysphondylium violaceum]|uniref:RNA-directed RNA polymerase n=1 Tax=Polysphondylium violaceum TaxID=133409 RepID=A0A8J4PTU5_9MYCE|nr:hypothetical protein CYY_005232 [Polysphondylium violaceum]
MSTTTTHNSNSNSDQYTDSGNIMLLEHKFVHCECCTASIVSFDKLYFLQERNNLLLEIDGLHGYGKTWRFVTQNHYHDDDDNDDDDIQHHSGGSAKTSFLPFDPVSEESLLQLYDVPILLGCLACNSKIGFHRTRPNFGRGYSLCLEPSYVNLQFDGSPNTWSEALGKYAGTIPLIQLKNNHSSISSGTPLVKPLANTNITSPSSTFPPLSLSLSNNNNNNNNNNNINNNINENDQLIRSIGKKEGEDNINNTTTFVRKPYQSTIIEKLPNVPTLNNYTPFDYQIESFHQAIEENTILVLPTGMGKTLVSILTLLEMHRLNGGMNDKFEKRLSLFLVDRVPLANQQYDTIKEMTGLKVLLCHGQIKHRDLLIEISKKKYDVLVGTVDSVLNLIEDGFLSIFDFHFITFDEIHHASPGHGYCKMMEHVNRMEYSLRPRILGLTASLVENSLSYDRCIASMKQLQYTMKSQIFKPFLLDTNYKKAVPEIVSIKVAPFQDTFLKQIYDCLILFTKFLQKKANYVDLDLDSVQNNNRFLFGLRKLHSKVEKLEHKIFNELMRSVYDMYDLISILMTQGPSSTLMFFEQIANNSPFKTQILHFIDNIIVQLPTNGLPVNSSFRFEKLLDILSRSDINGQFRCIVFVETRTCARSLIKLLDDSPFSFLEPKMFVGHSYFDGMSVNKQTKLIESFVNGETKLLVSTSVLEEGIDISNCNSIICYDGISSLRALIQRRGRARSDQNTQFTILSDESQIKILHDIVESEDIMDLAIRELFESRNNEKDLEQKKFHNIKTINNNTSIGKNNNDETVDYFTLSFHCVEKLSQFKEFIHSKYSSLVKQIVDAYENESDEFLRSYIMVQFVKPKKDSLNFIQQIYTTISKEFGFWMYRPCFPDLRMSYKYECKIQDVSFTYGNMKSPTTFIQLEAMPSLVTMNLRRSQIELAWGLNNIYFRYEDIEKYGVYEQCPNPDIPFDNFYVFCHRPCAKSVGFQKAKDQVVYDRVTTSPALGNSFTYRFMVHKDSRTAFMNALEKVGFQIYLGRIKELIKAPSPPIEPISQQYPINNEEVSYLLHVLVTNRRFGSFEISQKFLDHIGLLVYRNQVPQAKALIHYAMVGDGEKFISLEKVLAKKDKAYTTFKDIDDQLLEPHNLITKSIVITPSRILVKAPEEKLGCRILRCFGAENFLLLRFADEKEERFSVLNRKLQDYLFTILDEGIDLNGKHYDYVGSSKSQQREATVWMCTGLNVPKIRKWAGTIEKDARIFLNRFALQFSTTMPFDYIEPHNYYIVPDIIHNGQNFSEGCGLIGENLVQRIIEKFEYDSHISAFQIRIGGCKGVVVLSKNVNNPDGLYIRDSMRKYETPEEEKLHRTLEIISVNTSTKCKLNKQIINLFSFLGTPHKYFHKLLLNHLVASSQMLYDWNMAKSYINEFLPENNQDPQIIINDIFIKKVLNLHYKKNLETCLDKIWITVENSRNLLGVNDPYFVLGPDQVFIQIIEVDENGIRHPRVLEGQVAICKPPCLHPGDIRFVEAVHNPHLKQDFIDLLVFSTRGEIPVFSQASGSDLDGDRYFVFFDKNIIPPKQDPNHQPLVYSSPSQPKVFDENIYSSNSLAKKFVENLSQGFLSSIADHHLALCDMLNPGHEECVNLALQHFIEVDAPKTGKHGNVKEEIRATIKDRGYPHFMNKGDPKRTYYISTKLMGLIYDQISNMNWIADILHEKQLKAETLVKGYEIYLEEAQKAYGLYQRSIGTLISRFGAKSEEELLVGFYSNTRSRHSFNQEIKDYIKSLYLAEKKKLQDDFIREFWTESLDNTLTVHREEILKKLSAWYFVAYSDNPNTRKRNTVTSFYTFVNVFQPVSSHDFGDQDKILRTQNILSHFNQKKVPKLRKIYEKASQLVNEISKLLDSTPKYSDNIKVRLCGSVSTMLVDINNDNYNIDLFIEIVDKVKISQKTINNIADIILDSQIKSKQLETTNKTISFINDNHIITIYFEKKPYNDSRYMQQLFQSNPFLLPFIHIILDWAKESHTLKVEDHGNQPQSAKDNNLAIHKFTRWMLSWIIINYLYEKKFLKSYGTILKNVPCQPLSWWDDVFKRSLNYNFSIEKSGYLGEKFLSFFKDIAHTFGSFFWKDKTLSINYPFLDSMDCSSSTLSLSSSVSPIPSHSQQYKPIFSFDKTDSSLETYQYLRDQFLGGFHCAASTLEISDFLNNSIGNNTSKIITEKKRPEYDKSFLDLLKAKVEKGGCKLETIITQQKKKISFVISGNSSAVVQGSHILRRELRDKLLPAFPIELLDFTSKDK